MKYRLGFDIWALALFLVVMIPTIVWFAVPAADDVLRVESRTPAVDMVASVLQVLAILCLCFVINRDVDRLKFSPLVVLTVVSILVYFTGWFFYYIGISDPWVIVLLTIPPCAALVLFAIDRKNLPAVLLAAGFTLCHCLFAAVNFIF